MKKEGQLVTVTFWGTRGSIPTPGRSTIHSGGNTSCVEISAGPSRLILDGGSGLRLLGLQYVQNFHPQKPIRILISHTHIDHIVGLPFFAPALHPESRLQIYGPPGLRSALGRLFPFSILRSSKKVVEIGKKSFSLKPFKINSQWINHPGGALGYEIILPDGKRLLYLSDYEPVRSIRHHPLALQDSDLHHWIQRADLLIMDAQYREKEYVERRGWGHSSFTATVDLALLAGVKRLILYHHDPSHTDADLDRIEDSARKRIARASSPMPCSVAREGQKVTLR